LRAGRVAMAVPIAQGCVQVSGSFINPAGVGLGAALPDR
jgi:hypothetical protein